MNRKLVTACTNPKVLVAMIIIVTAIFFFLNPNLPNLAIILGVVWVVGKIKKIKDKEDKKEINTDDYISYLQLKQKYENK